MTLTTQTMNQKSKPKEEKMSKSVHDDDHPNGQCDCPDCKPGNEKAAAGPDIHSSGPEIRTIEEKRCPFNPAIQCSECRLFNVRYQNVKGCVFEAIADEIKFAGTGSPG